MKRVLVLLATSLLWLSVIGQTKFSYSSDVIKNFLSKEHTTCTFAQLDVNKTSLKSIPIFVGSRHITIDKECLSISFGVLTDSHNSQYYRTYFVPYSLYELGTLKEGNNIYYIDKWCGGPDFDTQGGSLDVKPWFVELISNIKVVKTQ